MTITPDSEFTQFYDAAGGTADAYKVSELNSVTSVVSVDSDWLTDTGFSFYSLSAMRERAKRKLFSFDYIDNDDIVDDWMNEWLQEMTNAAIDVNQDYSIGTVDIAHGTDGFGTITSTDFKELRKVEFTTNGNDWYMATKFHTIDFLPNEEFNETHPYFYMRGDSVISKKPVGQSGTARVTYYKMSTKLTDDVDELPVSMQNYTKSFVDYAVSQAYYLDEKAAMGDRYLQSAMNAKEQFISEIAPRNKTGPQYIKLVEPIDSQDDLNLDY